MWIFTKHSVVSVVEYDPTNGYADDGVAPQDRSKLLVRARKARHLAELGFADGEIISTPTNDYPYRVICDKTKFAAIMMDQVLGINYENFKAECYVAGTHPEEMLHEVWGSVRNHLDTRTGLSF
jgi:hypothetical protein